MIHPSGRGGRLSERKTDGWGWQQSLILFATTGILLIYLVTKVIVDGVDARLVLIGFSVALGGSFVVVRRHEARGHRVGRAMSRFLEVLLGLGMIWGFLVASAFADLPDGVKSISISVLLGLTVGAGLATLTSHRRESDRTDP